MIHKDNVRQAILAERIFDGQRWHDNAAVLVADDRIQQICDSGTVPSGCERHQLPAGAILAPRISRKRPPRN